MANEETRRKIVETALEMFNERGCRGVTMDDIAEALRMSKRTLYEVFDRKEDLLNECLMSVHENISRCHKEVYNRVAEPMLAGLYMIRVNAMSNHSYHRLIEETDRYYPEIHDRYFKLHTKRFREVVEESMVYAKKQKYLREGVDLATAIDFVCNVVQQKRISQVSDSETYARKMSEVCFTYLRGLMSVETIMRYEAEEENYKAMLIDPNKMMENQVINDYAESCQRIKEIHNKRKKEK